ncbi:hypothetical protein C4D60_Mb08t24960 [Musa balbisiana]|uniref:X8 domain-containing protein n=1 Tax=Musa balbisiana TaxID=52838 RepID=A0A4V4H968_MUSBA|nr:hypothetical protein C4D60_Mb08t24960 [Musa balbisiana]
MMLSLDDSRIAPSASYACANVDCTSLGYKTSCGDLDVRGNITYAFNSYYQKNEQDMWLVIFQTWPQSQRRNPPPEVAASLSVVRTSFADLDITVTTMFYQMKSPPICSHSCWAPLYQV